MTLTTFTWSFETLCISLEPIIRFFHTMESRVSILSLWLTLRGFLRMYPFLSQGMTFLSTHSLYESTPSVSESTPSISLSLVSFPIMYTPSISRILFVGGSIPKARLSSLLFSSFVTTASYTLPLSVRAVSILVPSSP